MNVEDLVHWRLLRPPPPKKNASVPMQPSLRTDFKAGISAAQIQSAVLLHSFKSTSIALPPSCTTSYTILFQSSKLASFNLLEVFSNN